MFMAARVTPGGAGVCPARPSFSKRPAALARTSRAGAKTNATRHLLAAPAPAPCLSTANVAVARAPAARVAERHASVVARCAGAAASGGASEEKKEDGGMFGKEGLTTLGFILFWYALNIGFNINNKALFNQFPFPWTVSTVHVIVGSIYCAVLYAFGFKDASFGRPIDKKEFGYLVKPATMHALGHIAANLSFAAVAISLTHTVKTLEPAFNVIMSKLILGTVTPLPVVATLAPIIIGVALASAAEVSFNWLGFITAMLSNLTFSFRAVWVKECQANVKNFTATNNYAYTSVISMFICAPLALIFEGGSVVEGAKTAIASMGATTFWFQLFLVGIFYHLYNQFAYQTLNRVSPVAHGVCNVVKRIVVIFSSVIFFGNVMTQKTIIGTCIAIAGTYLYTTMNQKYKAK